MATPPSKNLDWMPIDNPANSFEPSLGLKANGFSTADKPRYQNFNWMFRLVDAWIKYFKATADEQAINLATALKSVRYAGNLDASTGAYPTGVSQGAYYIISVAGTISGLAYSVDDWAVYNGTGWNRIRNTGGGGGGGGPATTDELPEGVVNLYFTIERARNAAVGNTITQGVLNVAPSQDAVFTAIAALQLISQKNAANGYAGLDGSGKILMSLIPTSLLGSVTYRGALDASAGVYPSSPAKGDYYVVSVAGTISGTSYSVKDWAIYNGTIWEKVSNSDGVTSVNGMSGIVVLNTDNVSEGSTNFYYTATRAKSDLIVNAINDGQTDTAPSQNAVYDALALKENTANKGTANGYAPLGSDSKVPTANLPDISGGLESQVVSTNTSAASNKMYFADMQTAAGNVQFDLPGGTDKAVVGLTAVGASTSQSKYPFLRAASGQSIKGVGAGNDLALDYDGASVIVYREDGSTEWFEARQTALAANPASSTVEGVVKKNRYQTKVLTSNVTANATTIFTFSNLEIGRLYKVSLSVTSVRGAAASKALIEIKHNSIDLGYAGFDTGGSHPVERASGFYVERVFQATSTTVTAVTSISGTGTIVGSSTPNTFMTLEELNNYESTTDWT